MQNWLWKSLWRCRKTLHVAGLPEDRLAVEKVFSAVYKLYSSIYDAIRGHFQPPFSDCLLSFSVQSGQKALLHKALGRQDICRTTRHLQDVLSFLD